jgi:hypothetical protein
LIDIEWERGNLSPFSGLGQEVSYVSKGSICANGTEVALVKGNCPVIEVNCKIREKEV